MVAAVFGLAATLAAVFAAHWLRRWRIKGKPQYGWWALSFLGYAIAFVCEAHTASSNWHSVWEYRLYLFASAFLVGALAVGTVHLTGKAKAARWFAVATVVWTAALAVLVLVQPIDLHGSWRALNAGQGAITGWTAHLYVVEVSVGGGVVIVAGVWSALVRRRWPPLCIAAGALCSALGGTLASQGMGEAVFPLTNLAGVILIFLGDRAARSIDGERSRLTAGVNPPPA